MKRQAMTAQQPHQFQGVWISGAQPVYGASDAGYYQDHPNTILVKDVYMTSFSQATITIGCLGYYVLFINHQRVGLAELNHDWTNPKACVYYETYDISSYLQPGKNELQISLGNAMFDPAPLMLLGKYNLRERLQEVGTPRVLCDLTVDGQVVLSSDETWCWQEGDILFNNVYLGETVDFTRTPSSRYPVVTYEEKRQLQPSILPKCKAFEQLYPQCIKPYQQGIYVEFNRMIAGFLTLTLQLKQHQQVVIQYSEHFENGQFDFSTSYAGSVGERRQDHVISGGKGAPRYAIQTDRIIGKAGSNHFRNRFSWHSFRYVYLQGCTMEQIQEISACDVHADITQTGFVQIDHPFLQQLFEAALHTKLNNIHATFEDCARERLGYGGDMVALAPSQLATFDLEAFYRKIILDFRYEQTPAGGIPETAPYVGIQTKGTGDGEGPLLWQLVYPYLLYKQYQYYGDHALLEQEYPYLLKQRDYLLGYDVHQLAQCCLGDHGSVQIAGNFQKATPDKAFIGYCAVLLLLKYHILLAQILQQDVRELSASYEAIRQETTCLFQRSDGSFGEGTQSSYAFAIFLQLGEPHKLCEAFVKQIIANQYVLDSGIFGMAFTYEVLHQYGYDVIIERWLLQKSDISFHAMLANGNQALAELFKGEHYSRNHAMFSSYQQWYYEGLGGIMIQEDACAFSHIKVRPYFSKAINQVSVVMHSKQGELRSSWFRDQRTIIWKLTVPQGITFEVMEPLDYQLLHQEQHDATITFLYQPA